jgi:hypothetical protein
MKQNFDSTRILSCARVHYCTRELKLEIGVVEVRKHFLFQEHFSFKINTLRDISACIVGYMHRIYGLVFNMYI